MKIEIFGDTSLVDSACVFKTDYGLKYIINSIKGMEFVRRGASVNVKEPIRHMSFELRLDDTLLAEVVFMSEGPEDDIHFGLGTYYDHAEKGQYASIWIKHPENKRILSLLHPTS